MLERLQPSSKPVPPEKGTGTWGELAQIINAGRLAQPPAKSWTEEQKNNSKGEKQVDSHQTKLEKLDRALSATNLVDYGRLLWWWMVMPNRLVVYRKLFGKEDERRLGRWLIASLIWFPLLYVALPATSLIATVILAVAWLLTGVFMYEKMHENNPLGSFLGFFIVVCWMASVIGLVIFGNVAVFVAYLITYIVLSFVAGAVIEDTAVVNAGWAAFVVGWSVGIILNNFFDVEKNHTTMTTIIMVLSGGMTFPMIYSMSTTMKESLKTGTPSLITRIAFVFLIDSHAFLIFFSFFGG